jgi:protein-tyrosine phosphatase
MLPAMHVLLPLQVQAWIDAALCGGGAVLVHCHEGKSRSVALLLAYLMISRGHTLATALAHIRWEGLTPK